MRSCTTDLLTDYTPSFTQISSAEAGSRGARTEASVMMTSKPRAGSSSGGGERVRSLDRQITALDLDCLREAFALFGAEREEAITTEELGKVRATQALEHGFAISGAVNRLLQNFSVPGEGPTRGA